MERVRKNRNLIVPDRFSEFEGITFEVKGLVVMKSTLTPAGPVYERIFVSELGQSVLDTGL